MVTFSLRDYGHVDHGYAATIHKAQGVTVDRAHVLASGHMDRHATYVALTRHRDGVSLHYDRGEFADEGQLARTLGRERAKDTSLDYGAGAEQVAAFAERRGLDPLRPESAIVVRQGPERPAGGPRPGQPAPTPEPAAADVVPRPETAPGGARGVARPAAAAGVAQWRERYAADKEQRAREAAQQAAMDAQARELVERWVALVEGYGAVLPTLERDPELGGARGALLRFGRDLRERGEAATALRQRGEEFGMAACPNLGRVLAARDPERAIRSWLDGYEAEMRAKLARERETALKQEAERLAQQQRAASRQSHGMSMG